MKTRLLRVIAAEERRRKRDERRERRRQQREQRTAAGDERNRGSAAGPHTARAVTTHEAHVADRSALITQISLLVYPALTRLV
jgi:hypothetical protein